MGTLVIINPHSENSCAPMVFRKIENRLFNAFEELFVAVTQGPNQVAEHLDRAAKADVNPLITLGGDGTNHIVLNALAERPHLKVASGSILIGTGRDWSWSLGMPEGHVEAVDWLAQARPVPCDLGKVEYLNMLTFLPMGF